MNHGRPPCTCKPEEVSLTLAAQVALRHLRRVLEEDRITIRFQNGYGVTICQAATEKQGEILEMLVLRFYGAGINDYRVAQYAPIPELNRGNLDEILNLCQHVALLPPSRAITGYSGRKRQEVKSKEPENRSSNAR
jgi:hypothetical protein